MSPNLRQVGDGDPLRAALRGVLLAAVESGPDAAGGIDSIQYRACGAVSPAGGPPSGSVGPLPVVSASGRNVSDSVVATAGSTARRASGSSSPSEAAVQAALAGRTAVVIAHRLSTVRAADLILVIEDGRGVERGTRTDLVSAGGGYEELYRTQFDQPSAVAAAG